MRSPIIWLVLFLAAAAPAQDAPGELPYRDDRSLNEALRRAVGEANRDARASRARVVVLGASRQGREILAVEIGTERVAAPLGADASGAMKRTWGQKSALLVVAGLEGDRLIGTSVAADLALRVLALPEAEQDELLGDHQLYVVPRANPDGAARYFEGLADPEHAGDRPARFAHAGNARPVDWDRDGRSATTAGRNDVNEDVPLDLDGDGMILTMRRQSGLGTLVPDPDDPRLLREADPEKGEKGVYERFVEARDRDGDGEYGENPSVGVAVHRNFPHAFAEHDLAAGTFAASEPETRALLDYVLARSNVEMILVYGAHDNLGRVPEAGKDAADSGGNPFRRRKPVTQLQKADRELWVAVAKLYEETCVPSSDAAKPTGAFHEWGYFHFGVPSFAVNLFEVSETPGDDEKGRAEKRAKELEKAKAGGEGEGGAADPAAPGPEPDPIDVAMSDVRRDGFVAWHEQAHPDLGTVEIGGWKPFVRTNPTPAVARIIADRQWPFLKSLMGRFAHVHVPTLEARKLGDGLYEVTAVVANDGPSPTATVQGDLARSTGPVLVELHRAPRDVIHGAPRHQIDTLAGRVGQARFEWRILGRPGERIQVVFGPPKSHPIVKEVTLP